MDRRCSSQADTARRAGTGASWPSRASGAERWAAAFVAVCLLSVIGLAAWTEPSPTGVGTHERLGLQPCVWLMATGRPCPTCGMTTSFAHAANGDLRASLLTQPLGAMIAIGSAVGFWIALHTAVCGSNAGRLTGLLFSGRGVGVGIGALLAAWGYKLLTFGG
ncbi:MAG TPA: hypothetical protein DEB06_03280 [Phycisphaerales bacterium]|nr:hypothetical protein [Phycisphaerales bacterium]